MLARRTVNPAVRTVRARRDPTVSSVPGWAQAPDIGRALLTMLRTVAGLRIGRRGRGPVCGPSHLCNQCAQGHRRHGSVVSVQLARMMHEAVPLIIRRSWVRAPPPPPTFPLAVPNQPILLAWDAPQADR